MGDPGRAISEEGGKGRSTVEPRESQHPLGQRDPTERGGGVGEREGRGVPAGRAWGSLAFVTAALSVQ